MNVLYIINGLGFSKSTGIGGSDKRAVELVRNSKELYKKNDYGILTTQSGYNIFTNTEKVDTIYHTIKQPRWWPKKLNYLLVGRVFSYIYALFSSIFKVKEFKNYDLFFSTTDFFFDVIPGYVYKKRHNKKLLCMIHHHITNPLARNGPFFINIAMYMSQRFGLWLILNTADAIFFYDTDEGRNIEKSLKNKKRLPVYFVKNGIDDKLIDKTPSQPKEYEACFLGGLRYSKGIKEFIPIWKEVVNKFPQAKFLVIGGGSKEIVDFLKKKVTEEGLERNIIFTGPLPGGYDLFSKVKQSRLFLFPSHEEGWGIALCEAMYCGLPIICYKLPAFKTFGDVLDKYDVGDYESLANKVIEYLENPETVGQKEPKLIATAKKYTWSSIAKEDHRMYEEIVKTSS